MYKNTEVQRPITTKFKAPRFYEKSETLGLAQMGFKTHRYFGEKKLKY